jgi:hypothetical protein
LTYLPVILGPVRRDGPWYFSLPESEAPGAIRPTVLLRPAEENQNFGSLATPTTITLTGEPYTLALTEGAGLGAVVLADGRLEIVDLMTRQSKGAFFTGDNLQAITPGPSDSAQVYVSREGGLVQADLRAGIVVKQVGGLGRLRGLAWDAATGRLFVADAEHDQLLVFSGDFVRQQASVGLPCQPDQVILDGPARQIYISCPAAPQVLALNPDTLLVTAQAALNGGPILDLAFDPNQQRLYALNALAPAYRGITVWQTPQLEPIALVAGTDKLPLQTASTFALTPEGQLLISERDELWQISPTDFSVSRTGLAAGEALRVQPTTGTIYALDGPGHLLRIY